MWNVAVNNISYPIYPLSARTEKGYITKMIPFFFCSVYKKKTEEIRLSDITKTPIQTENEKVTTQNASKTFDYTTIADRHRTVSWSDGHPNDGIPTFPVTRENVRHKTIFKISRFTSPINTMYIKRIYNPTKI